MFGDSLNIGVKIHIDFTNLSLDKSPQENLDAIQSAFELPGLAGTGMDRIVAAGDISIAIGGDGNDTIDGGPGILSLLFGNRGDNTITAKADFNLIVGGDNNDKLTGGEIANVIFGDTFDLASGSAGLPDLEALRSGRIVAGVGLFAGGNGDDHITGGSGFDLLIAGDADDTIFGGIGLNVVFCDAFDIGIGRSYDFADVFSLSNLASLFAAPNDILGSFLPFQLSGAGNDKYTGGDSWDIVLGRSGNDDITGAGGVDFLIGGFGDDIVDGGVGPFDPIVADDGDIVFGGPGNNLLYGRDGNDHLESKEGDDIFYGGPGNDRIFGGADNDILYGEEGDDELHGENGDDALHGGPGRDVLFGDSGNNFLDWGPDDNLHPVLEDIGDRFVNEGSSLTISVTASDPNPEDTLTFSLDPGAYTGASIDPLTGVFTWLLADGPLTAEVCIRVNDNGSPPLSHARTFTITVKNVGPTAAITGPTTGVRGQPHLFTLGASDVPADQATGFTFQINWGDGSTETISGLTGLAIDHAFQNSGTYTVKLTARDKDDGVSEVVEQTMTVTAYELQDGVLTIGGTPGGDIIPLHPGSGPSRVNYEGIVNSHKFSIILVRLFSIFPLSD